MRNKLAHGASAGVIVGVSLLATGAYHHQLQVYEQHRQGYIYAQQQKAKQAKLEATRKAIINAQLNAKVVNGHAVGLVPPQITSATKPR